VVKSRKLGGQPRRQAKDKTQARTQEGEDPQVQEGEGEDT
jgi:hypothetical protein